MISRTSYNGFQYTHQGWLLEDGRHLLLDDELDEMQGTTVDNTNGVRRGRGIEGNRGDRGMGIGVM